VGNPAPAGVAQTASLSGELLESQEALPGNETTVGGTCDRDATTTLSFTTTGAAQGPYVGAFMESGTITIGPQTNANVLYQAEIDAPTGARSDSGNAGLVIETAAIPPTTSFLESFNSTEPPPPDCDEDEQGDEDCQGENEQ
jgi:hypothetical protein